MRFFFLEEIYSPGVYIVHDDDITVRKDISLESELVCTLPYKTQIEIVKFEKNAAERRIRGQLANGNWVSIEHMDNGLNFIVPYENSFFEVKTYFFWFKTK